MPGRNFQFATGEIYHIFNRGIDHRKTFTNAGDYERALLALEYYRVLEPPMKLSVFLSQLTKEEQVKDLERIQLNERLVSFFSFCLIPNHFHMMLRQEAEKGIQKFVSIFLNSYTRFFNTAHERVGPLFLNQFKAVRINSESQLLHTLRYILLNPYSAGVVKTLKDLEKYPYSSLPEYLGRTRRDICDKTMVLSQFKDRDGFKNFILDQADYQKSLEEIKHLIIE